MAGETNESVPTAEEIAAQQAAVKKANYDGAKAHYLDRLSFALDVASALDLTPELRAQAFERVLEDVLQNDRLNLQAELQGKLLKQQQAAQAALMEKQAQANARRPIVVPVGGIPKMRQ